VNIDLPGLGSCLTISQQITLSQHSGFDNALLSCGVSEKDPSCSIDGTVDVDFLAKCDVTGDSVDADECVVMRLEIAGEQPTLGAGAAMTVTKVGPDCASDCILGPACTPCNGFPPAGNGDECLTRTPGFWGNHPSITSLFLPITVCGETLSVVAANDCGSVTEALCVAPGKESRGNKRYGSLVRALAAAKLNLAATAGIAGSCGDDISTTIADCEALCGADQKTISQSGCVQDLTDFNELPDTVLITPSPFDSPGPAVPGECKDSRGNGLVIGVGACNN
jgi:hypothetical protein